MTEIILPVFGECVQDRAREIGKGRVVGGGSGGLRNQQISHCALAALGPAVKQALLRRTVVPVPSGKLHRLSCKREREEGL